jgi:hypothetical protein
VAQSIAPESRVAILHFFNDDENPRGIVSSLVDALPSGSCLTITNLTAGFMDLERSGQICGDGSQAPRHEASATAAAVPPP